MEFKIFATFVLTTFYYFNNAIASSICDSVNSPTYKQALIASPKRTQTTSAVAAHISTTVTTKKRPAFMDSRSTIKSLPRGGDIAGIAAKDVAKFFSGLVSVDALSGTFFPSASCELGGVKVPPRTIRRLSVEAIGGAAGSLSITSYLAVTEKVSSIEEAIAYGFISRVLFLVRGILTNPTGMAQMMPKFKIELLLYASLIFAVLSGLSPKLPTLLLVRAVVAYTLLKSLSSYFFPSKSGLIIYNTENASEGELTAQLWQFSHGYTIMSCFHAMLLLYGIAPVKAVGFTALLFLVWFLDITLIKKLQDMVPIEWLRWMTPLVFPLFGAIAKGTLTK